MIAIDGTIATDKDRIWLEKLDAVLVAAQYWGEVQIPEDHYAILTNWLFAHDQIAEEGVVQIRPMAEDTPGTLIFDGCTWSGNSDFLAVADLIICLIDAEIQRLA